MASKIDLNTRELRLLAVLRWCFFSCLFIVCMLPLVVGVYLVSLYFLVLQSSRWGKESWLLDFCCVLNVMSLLSFFESSLWCHGLVCSV